MFEDLSTLEHTIHSVEWMKSIGQGIAMSVVAGIGVYASIAATEALVQVGTWIERKDAEYQNKLDSGCDGPCLKNLFYISDRYQALLK